MSETMSDAPSGTAPAARLSGLVKRFPGFDLGPLDLTLEAGTVLALVGPVAFPPPTPEEPGQWCRRANRQSHARCAAARGLLCRRCRRSEDRNGGAGGDSQADRLRAIGAS